MEEVEASRKKALQAAIAALCVEVGFMSIEKEALDVLTEILQSYVTELGRTARMYSELSLRTEPTLSDVHLALVDAGACVDSLPEYSKRPQRRHLPRQLRNYPQAQPRSLQVGSKRPRPSHVPPHLPPLPDPHTYINTPTFASPVSDYRSVREKLATQKRNARKGLSSLLAKTRPSRPITGEGDPFGLFTVVTSSSPTMPLYLQALMPTLEDQTDAMTTKKPTNEEGSSAENSQSDSQEGNSSDPSMDTTAGSNSAAESYENPFLKPAKRIKVKLL